jgi:hypothetical protein
MSLVLAIKARGRIIPGSKRIPSLPLDSSSNLWMGRPVCRKDLKIVSEAERMAPAFSFH